MIDPFDVIKFDRTHAELEEWLVFSVCVAGKVAVVQAKAVDRFLNSMTGNTPFEKIQNTINDNVLTDRVKDARIGQYTRLDKCFREMVHLDLFTCSVDDLTSVHGIGPKTARMFLMHSRPNQRVAALDTHILRFLRDNGYHDAPKATPSSAKAYKLYEAAFLELADKNNISVAEFDLQIWKQYTRTIPNDATF